MPSIRILPDRVANQIAAGEVIERPAAVVKELVENSLDAGGTRIEVEFRQGGRALMRVEDNGCGMGRDDAVLALERHATSKIAEAADLDRLSTFGFRGEALPSMASVARLTLQTRPAGGDVGTQIAVNGGKLVYVRECGRPVGTSIEVAHLFEPVPARRKFLKSDATEAAHIIQCVRLYALAAPGTAFTLIEDGRVIFRSPTCATLAERVGEIFGRQLADTLVSVESADGGMRLSGLISRPGLSRATRHETITFVNGRPVDSRALTYALVESYQESLPKGRYPAAVVFFECDPAAVDVNVHPAKREVRFRNETAVRGFVIRGVLSRLRELGAAAAPTVANYGRASQLTVEKAGRTIPGPPSPSAATQQVEQRPVTGPVREPSERLVGGDSPHPPSEGRSARYAAPAEPSRPAVGEGEASGSVAGAGAAAGGPAWRFIGLAHGDYALFETGAGIVLLDRRAAQERIWFERLREQSQAKGVPSQRLLFPAALEFDPILAAILTDQRACLLAHGFEIAEFGRNFFRLEAMPAWMEPADAEPFLRDILGAFREGRLAGRNPNLARDELARLAAARAARRSNAAGEQEMQVLVGALFATRSPLTSPAGRPTFIEIGHAELARRLQKG